MKIDVANIEDSYHVHCNMVEYMKDIGEDFKLNPSIWMQYFANPFFVCVIGTHGKRQTVGQIWGIKDPINKSFILGGIFIRRKFRKKTKFLLPLIRGIRKEIDGNDIKNIVFSANETTQKRALRRKFKLDKFLMERAI